MSAPLVTPSRDALKKSVAESIRYHPATIGIPLEDRKRLAEVMADSIATEAIAFGAVIDAATLTDDETVRAVAYRYAEGEATYAASTVRHVLRALADVLAERGEQHG